MSPGTVALLVAVIASIGGVITAWLNSRSTTKTTAQAAVSKALDQVYDQRLLFRDEQIIVLRKELAEQAAAHRQQIERLSADVARLTALVIKLGGDPDEQQ